MSFLRKGWQARPERWTISELTAYIRELFEVDYRLHDVEVTGELSNFTQARSGHLYFTLKDEKAQLKSVMWRTSASRLTFDPQDGDEVIVSGKVSIYETGGVYQLYATHMEPVGRGQLATAFAELKERLHTEGLFEAEHKQAIPTFPRKLGIVTSADAAALRDILNVLRRRCPLVSVLIAPALVQGKDAPQQLVRSLQWLDAREDIDTILLSRGGGSMEDLWAFNDEGLARAIFAAKTPVISGVGHEVDFTIADFVADLRAPTPSAAAELAVPDLAEFAPLLAQWQTRLTHLLEERMVQAQDRLAMLAQNLRYLSPQRRLRNEWQLLDGLAIRLDKAIEARLNGKAQQVLHLETRLQALDPIQLATRGYVLVTDENGRFLTTTTTIQKQDTLTLHFVDAQVTVTVQKKELKDE